MKIILALCFVAAVAQAIDVDWSQVSPIEVSPRKLAGPLTESLKDVENPDPSRVLGGEEASDVGVSEVYARLTDYINRIETDIVGGIVSN